MPRADYVLDVPYPRSFVHQASPPMLRLVAALNGHRAPDASDASDATFTYCDLGTGTADTLLTFAAANPRGRFYGVDFNPQQIATARARAQKAELENVRLLECDFAELLEQDLPPLDFLVAHGIWTWVSAEKREAILAFARSRLKPGGLFYVSYDALPAWAALEPLRRLMLEHTRHLDGSTLERARAGYELVKQLAEGEAGYFRAHPTARSMLFLMEKAGLPYVAHEYFHEHWEPMYVADVARSLSRSGLAYVGQVPLHLNLPELAIPPKLKAHARTLTERIDLEMWKDYALNEPFRADVYIHGSAPGLAEVRRSYFAETTFALAAPLPLVTREVPLTPYTLDLGGPVYDAILGALAAAPASAQSLVVRPELAELGVTRIADALQNLVLGSQVTPVAAPAPRRTAEAFNRDEMDLAIAGERSSVLAAPGLGLGLTLNPLDTLCLYVWTSVAVERRKSWLRSFTHRSTLPLKVGGRVVSDSEERTRLLLREVERFIEQWRSTLDIACIVPREWV